MSGIAVDGARDVQRASGPWLGVHRQDAPEPWVRRDGVVLSTVLLAAVVGLLVSWAGVAGSGDLNGQAGWLALGIAALLVGGFGMVFWLAQGTHEIALLRRGALAEIDRRRSSPTPAVPARADFGTVAGMRRYHRGDCQMLIGKDVHFAAATAHAESRLTSCPICLADTGGAA